MHIILGILTLLGTLFWLYRRFSESGLRLSSFNPFLWKRRHDWKQRRQMNPLFILDNPKDVAAALLFIIAKLDGELTRESKSALDEDYQSLLKMSPQDAQATLQQTSFMIEQYPIVQSDLAKILNESVLRQFSPAQINTLMAHLPIVASRENAISAEQQSWITTIEKCFEKINKQMF